MAVALEFYQNKTATSATSTAATYQTFLTLNCARSGKAAKDFYVIAHINLGTSHTDGWFKVRWQKGGVTIAQETGDIDIADGDGGNRYTVNLVKKLNFAADSTTTITVQFQNSTATGTITAYNASIVALEASANSVYAERTTELRTSTAAWTDVLTLNLNPASQTNYLLVWAGFILYEDEDDPDCKGARFLNDTDTVIYQTDDGTEWNNSNCNDQYFTQGGVAYETVEASSHNFKIQIYGGGGASDEAAMNNVAMIAIPESDFVSVTKDSQTTATSHSQTPTEGYTDSNVSQAPTLTSGANHLALFGVQVSETGTGGGEGGYWQIVAGGDTHEQRGCEKKIYGTSSHLGMAVMGGYTSGGSTTFKIQGAVEDEVDADTGYIEKAYMWIAEIAAAVTYNTNHTTSVALEKQDTNVSHQASAALEQQDTNVSHQVSVALSQETETNHTTSVTLEQQDNETNHTASVALEQQDNETSHTASVALEQQDNETSHTASVALEQQDNETSHTASVTLEQQDTNVTHQASAALEQQDTEANHTTSVALEQEDQATRTVSVNLTGGATVNIGHEASAALEQQDNETSHTASVALEQQDNETSHTASIALEQQDNETSHTASVALEQQDTNVTHQTSAALEQQDNETNHTASVTLELETETAHQVSVALEQQDTEANHTTSVALEQQDNEANHTVSVALEDQDKITNHGVSAALEQQDNETNHTASVTLEQQDNETNHTVSVALEKQDTIVNHGVSVALEKQNAIVNHGVSVALEETDNETTHQASAVLQASINPTHQVSGYFPNWIETEKSHWTSVAAEKLDTETSHQVSVSCTAGTIDAEHETSAVLLGTINPTHQVHALIKEFDREVTHQVSAALAMIDRRWHSHTLSATLEATIETSHQVSVFLVSAGLTYHNVSVVLHTTPEGMHTVDVAIAGTGYTVPSYTFLTSDVDEDIEASRKPTNLQTESTSKTSVDSGP
jgi:hypothetical protein